MEHRISILFYARKSRQNKEKLAPIYVRITVNGQRLDQCIHRNIDPNKWNPVAGRAKGNSAESIQLNQFLDVLTAKILKLERELVQDGQIITFENVKDKWLGTHEKPRMLLEIFQEHNDQVKALVGKDFAPATLERYITSRKHTQAFLQWKFKIADIDIRHLDYQFISEYEFWLKTVRNCDHNSAMKYLSNFRKIVNICIKRGWLPRDPFFGFKMSKRTVVREFLTQEELDALIAKDFRNDRLNHVRDIFAFSCFTGLAYADVKKLATTEIAQGVDGDYWIFTTRQKTDTPSRIPLLPAALGILAKYKDYPPCIHSGKALPVLSNQKMNCYLKEVATICSIHKELTFHIARHTFATTVTLSNGVPIESVSKMLGHKNIKTTQHYAKILDNKVSNDMQLLKQKLASKTS